MKIPKPHVGLVFWLLRAGPHWPKYRRCEIRAIVDDDQIVYRSWSIARGWMYVIESDIWWKVITDTAWPDRPGRSRRPGVRSICFTRADANAAEAKLRKERAA